ncbi:probable methyltransferase PMT19 [Cicer arietinum]|uniref:Methyltransferase n=1 Tax=Cicer arietinum TaxID=3827 RepID=A0A1S2Z8S4_CICAR|nr:probable methyltransferase PMT19 [Cicer arietinum]
MTPCIFPLQKVKDINKTSSGVLEKWPMRLNALPPRIKNENDNGFTLKVYNEDNKIWKKRVSYYSVMLKSLSYGGYRNVMDMNAGFGRFAAAMRKYQVWVMNVVPFDAKSNNLGIIYERGLIGTYMDWCDITDIILEMHRILRREGTVIIRDFKDIILKVKEITDRMIWEGGTLVKDDDHNGSSQEMIMIFNNTN